MRKNVAMMLGLIVLSLCGKSFGSLATIRVEPAIQNVQVGDTVNVVIRADFTDLVVGWGLDLGLSTTGVVHQVGAPSIESPWIPVTGIDGDGLSGLASPFLPVGGVVTGLGIELATIQFQADAIGTVQLNLTSTPGDLTEGVAQFPTGFADLVFVGGTINVVPEPATCGLLAVIAMLALKKRRTR